METYVALLRGINVGGHHKLPMKELRALLAGLGLQNVNTYIQSGNVVFQGDDVDTGQLAAAIGAEIEKAHGFEPRVLLLPFADMEKAIAANPFPEAEAAPKTLHLYFLASVPAAPDLEGLAALKKENERFELKDTVFYLHAPDGIGRSKLAAKAEQLLGVPATARNWRTVAKIKEMAEAELPDDKGG